MHAPAQIRLPISTKTICSERDGKHIEDVMVVMHPKSDVLELVLQRCPWRNESARSSCFQILQTISIVDLTAIA